MPIAISIVGKKGSGKSEALEALITFLTSAGFRVGVLKHMARETIEVDKPGTDTFRYRMSGAQKVILAGKKRLAVFANLSEELPLEEIMFMFRDFDLVFTEGYVQDELLKIEVHKRELGSFLSERTKNVIAICSDGERTLNIPFFSFEELHELAKLIENKFLKQQLSIHE